MSLVHKDNKLRDSINIHFEGGIYKQKISVFFLTSEQGRRFGKCHVK